MSSQCEIPNSTCCNGIGACVAARRILMCWRALNQREERRSQQQFARATQCTTANSEVYARAFQARRSLRQHVQHARPNPCENVERRGGKAASDACSFDLQMSSQRSSREERHLQSFLDSIVWPLLTCMSRANARVAKIKEICGFCPVSTR